MEATWEFPGAAIHRHILDRVNTINDSLKKVIIGIVLWLARCKALG